MSRDLTLETSDSRETRVIGSFTYRRQPPTEEGWYRHYTGSSQTVSCVLVGPKGQHFWWGDRVVDMHDPLFAQYSWWGPAVEF